MSYQATDAVLKHSRSKGTARMVLFVIASHADKEGRGARLSMETIAREANSKPRATQYAVAELEASGELVIVYKGCGKGNASVYDVSPVMRAAVSDKGAEFAPFNSDSPPATEPSPPPNGAEYAPLSDAQRAQSATSKGANFNAKGAENAPQPYEPENTQPPQQPAREAVSFPLDGLGVFESVFGEPPPIYGQDLITNNVTDLSVWRGVCEQWKGNNNDRTRVWNMINRYQKLVAEGEVGNGKTDGGSQISGRGNPPQAANGNRRDARLAALREQDSRVTFTGRESTLDRKAGRTA